MRSTDRQWRLLGSVIGLLVAVVVGVQGRVATGAGALGAEVRMRAAPTGELAIAPAGPFLVAEDLRPGNRVGGRMLVRNQTGVALNVTTRATASAPLPDAIRLRVQVGGVVVGEGALASLLDGTLPVVVPSGEEIDATFEVWVEAGSTEYQGRVIDLDLRFDVRAEGR